MLSRRGFVKTLGAALVALKIKPEAKPEIKPEAHEHLWMRRFEQNILGFCVPDGYECETCGIGADHPHGGSIGRKEVLYGENDALIQTNSGVKCKRQVWDGATDKITYE